MSIIQKYQNIFGYCKCVDTINFNVRFETHFLMQIYLLLFSVGIGIERRFFKL